MVPWRFMAYITSAAKNPIRAWYEAQDPEAQAALDFTMYQLKVLDDWIEPERKQFSLLKRKHAGLGELRFWADERKFRVAGLYRPNQRQFIMLVGCEKRLRGIIYEPSNVFAMAMKYKADFEAGKGHIIDYV